MPQARDEAGNIWEVDAQGNAVALVQPAAAGQVFNLPQNPKDVAMQTRQANRDAATDADRAADNVRADRALQLAEERAARTRNGPPVTAKQRAEWKANLSNVALLEQTLEDLQEQYDTHFKGKGMQSIGEEFAPARFAPQYGVFDTTAQSMLADMAKAKGLTAQQFNTPAEQRMFFEPLIPKRGDPDEVIESKLANLRRMIGTGRNTLESNLGIAQQRADKEVDDPTIAADLKDPGPTDTSGSDFPPANMPGGNDPSPVIPASGATRTIERPEIASMAYSMMRAGAGFATIKAALGQKDAPFTMAMYNEGKKRLAANPNANPFTSKTEVPLNPLQRLAGSSLGAGLANYADMATAGTAGALAGEQGQGALDAMRAMHPDASTAGQILGGLTGAIGGEALLAARAPQALARFAPRASDAMFGALSGFNAAEDGEGASGALWGAGAGLAGGYLGEGAARVGGAALRGVGNPAVRYLRDRGIPLTVGQTVGDSGRLGQFVKNTEDALTSIPGVGGVVNARRTEGLEGFNRAAFQDAAAPGAQITATGAPGMAQVRQSVGDAYNRALDPVNLDIAGDPAALADITNAQLLASAIPQVGDDAAQAIDYRIGGGLDLNGAMTGRDFQEAYRGLARDGRAAASGSYANEYAGAMREGQDALAEALERQNPGAFEGFLEANAANRRGNVLAQALNPNAADELITPAQLNRADFNSTSRLTNRVNAASGNRPFYELANAGQAVLPSRLPDSGTANRMMTGMALGGAGLGGAGGYAVAGPEGSATGAATGLGSIIALAIGGSRPAQRLLTGALLNRPAIARAAGQAVQRNAQLGGGFGAGVLTPLLVGP